MQQPRSKNNKVLLLSPLENRSFSYACCIKIKQWQKQSANKLLIIKYLYNRHLLCSSTNKSEQNMAYFRKQLERRTYSQDRYYILIKRQRSGKATFNELTELDEIVNRVPDIREKVILENFMAGDEDESPNDPNKGENLYIQKTQKHNLWNRIGSFFGRVFTSHITIIKSGRLTPLF